MAVIGILGGTFDPVHLGHTQVATTAYDYLPLSQLRFIPCGAPVHKSAVYADAKHRLAMLELAIAGIAGFVVDDREVTASEPSYTVSTIKALRREFREQPLCLIMGEDSFLSLPEWHDWQALVSLVHIVVVNRSPKQKTNEQPWLAHHKVSDPKQLVTQAAGLIFELPMEPVDISASDIRKLIVDGKNPQQWLPPKVWQYIQQQQLYGYIPK